MKPYIFGKRNLIHIIDVKETLRGILLARKFVSRTVAQGKDILFVGTKRQARKAVEENALRVSMHYVNDRWLGGTLTNFREIRKRIGRLDQLEEMERDGLLDQYSKKQGASLRREMRKIRRNLGGIRRMQRHPGGMVVIDQRREIIAVREARKVGIPVVCLLDTDSDPDLIDIPIPGNDDAMRGIELIVRELANAAAEGVNARGTTPVQEEKPAAPRRRSVRPTTARAEPATPKAAPAAPAQPETAPTTAAPAAAPASPKPAPTPASPAPAETEKPAPGPAPQPPAETPIASAPAPAAPPAQPETPAPTPAEPQAKPANTEQA